MQKARLLIIIPLFLFICLQLKAQIPQGINYQAILRNPVQNYAAIPDTSVQVTFEILETTPQEPLLYKEVHETTTNGVGLINLVIGTGTPVDGDFSNIEWGSGQKSLRVSVSLGDSGPVILLGTNRLVSVPYALYAQKSGNSLEAGPGIMITADTISAFDDSPSNELQDWSTLPGIPSDIADGDQVDDADSDPSNELQDWSTLPGIPSDIADGDQVDDADSDPSNELQDWNTLPGIPADIADGDQVDDADSDPSNELQDWNTLPGIPSDIADGDQVDDADSDPNNELQDLILDAENFTLGITNGGTVDLSELQNGMVDADPDPTNELQDWSTLPGIPADIADGDQVDDADSDPSNELQDWNTLPGIPADIADGDQVDDADSDPSNELQDWNTLPGIPADIADGDQVDDADSDPSNELQDWNTLPGIPSDIADGDQVDDADSDPNNELQTLSLNNQNQLVLSNGGAPVSLPEGTVYTSGSGIVVDNGNAQINALNESSIWDANRLMDIPINGSTPPSGAALVFDENTNEWKPAKLGGDANGNWDSLEVTKIRRKPVGGMGNLEDGKALVYDADQNGGTWDYVAPTGDVSGKWDDVEVTKIRRKPVGGMGNLEDGKALVYDADQNGGTWDYVAPTGDVSGKWDDVEVTKIRRKPVGGMGNLEDGKALVYDAGQNGGTWDYVNPSGDITGTFKNMNIDKIQGVDIDMSNLQEGASLALRNDGSGWMLEPEMIGGDGNFSIPFSDDGFYNQPMLDLENTGGSASGIRVISQASDAIKGISYDQASNFNLTALNSPNFTYPAGLHGESITNHGFSGVGVLGRAVSSNENHGLGGLFQGNSVGSIGVCYFGGLAGVLGWASDGKYGGYFVGSSYDENNLTTAGVVGLANGADYGGYFQGSSTQFAGVRGQADHAQYGGWFEGSSSSDAGLYADDNGAPLAAFFSGDVQVTGDINKSAVNFKIDHPQDPANKFLVHTAIESPDMKNMYDGIITTDETGYATVELPGYFESLNKDFRYQLTVIGTFAQAIIKEKILSNKFVIQTSEPLVEVSWQVTGIRKDPYAEANRTIPELDKKGDEKGKYIHPELYNQPETKSLFYHSEKPNVNAGRELEKQ